MMKKLSIFVAFGVGLSGCGAFVPVVKIDEMTAEQRHKIRSVQIYNQAQLANKEFTVLTIVEGNSCQNKLYEPPATRAAAIEQLKYHAIEAQGDGITNIQCGGREGTSTRTNCWELISCTAEVIKLNK
jgi:hypothetical protein